MKRNTTFVMLFACIMLFGGMTPPSTYLQNLTGSIWKISEFGFTPLTEFDTLVSTDTVEFDTCQLNRFIQFDSSGIFITYWDSLLCEDSIQNDTSVWSFHNSETRIVIIENGSLDTSDNYNIDLLSVDSLVISKTISNNNFTYTGRYRYYNISE